LPASQVRFSVGVPRNAKVVHGANMNDVLCWNADGNPGCPSVTDAFSQE
jgi:hypothetical protein